MTEWRRATYSELELAIDKHWGHNYKAQNRDGALYRYCFTCNRDIYMQKFLDNEEYTTSYLPKESD